MQGRKASSGQAKPKSSSQTPRSSKNLKQQRLQVQLKKANELRRELQQRIANLNAEWKEKIRRIEEEALDKARSTFEREFLKKEEARKKAIDAAVSKFEKGYSSGRVRKSKSRSTTGTRRTRSSAKTVTRSQGQSRKRSAISK